jgi:hypothetical protein
MTEVFFAESGVQAFTEFRRGSGRLVFIDSMNYFAVSLKELAIKVGMEKMDVDPLTGDTENVVAYCKNDVAIVQKAVSTLVAWFKANDLGNMQRTLASLSMAAFRHRFMHHKIFIHAEQPVLALEREAYHGGRVEVFYQGKAQGQFYQLDVNSMYPSLMQHYRVPNKLIYYARNGMIQSEMKKRMKHQYLIARVTLTTEEERYPLKRENRLLHPIGTFETVLCHTSLLSALCRGQVKKVHEVACYQAVVLFDRFVAYFWSKREEAEAQGDKINSYFFKKLMNTLYGKFGQRRTLRIVKDCPKPDAFDSSLWVVDGLHCTRWRFAGKEVWILPTHCQSGFCVQPKECDKSHCLLDASSESYHSFPAIAAAITDYARCFLWQLIVTAGLGHVYYVDTDCLVVDQAGKDALSSYISAELGDLKIEKEFTSLEIYSPKDYTFGDKKRLKGVKTKAVYDEEKKGYRQDQFERFRGGLRKGNPEGINVASVLKHLSRELTTRRPHPGGWTRPFVLGVERGGTAPG